MRKEAVSELEVLVIVNSKIFETRAWNTLVAQIP